MATANMSNLRLRCPDCAGTSFSLSWENKSITPDGCAECGFVPDGSPEGILGFVGNSVDNGEVKQREKNAWDQLAIAHDEAY